MLDSNEIGIPGGAIGFGKDYSPLAQQAVTRWNKLLGNDSWGFPCLKDPDFVENFIETVIDLTEQEHYVQNTAAYLGGKEDYDPHYVLVFRRSLSSAEPRLEQHWTSDYITARRGLKREITGPHRLFSVVLCDNLARLEKIGLASEQKSGAVSDGEIKIKRVLFDQKKCILSFRPKDQQRELDDYLQTSGALSIQDLFTELIEIKK